ncbi:hypothetical protein [Nocardia sp. NRRL S-836]|nr:hypothetical protein [Nocardia sp. NRRL S-836]
MESRHIAYRVSATAQWAEASNLPGPVRVECGWCSGHESRVAGAPPH